MSNVKKNVYMVMGPDGILTENYSSLTTRVDKVDYLWTIHNYSFHVEKGGELRSPIFTSATNDKCKWVLELMPRCETKDQTASTLNVVLDYSSEWNVVFGRFNTFILDSQHKKIRSFVSDKICKFEIIPATKWGYNFITKKQLSTNKLFPNNKLTIYFEMMFSEVESSIDISNQLISNQLKHRVIKEDLSEDFERIFESQDFTDVVISVKEKRFPVHKFILIARSPVFAAMFKHTTKESESNHIEIADIDEKVIEEMLYYMYTGKFKNLDGLASGLLGAADKYEIESMKAKCEDALLRNLSVENSVESLVLADLHRAHELKSRAISFIIAKSGEVMNTESWNKMVYSSPHLTNEVCRELARRSSTVLSQ